MGLLDDDFESGFKVECVLDLVDHCHFDWAADTYNESFCNCFDTVADQIIHAFLMCPQDTFPDSFMNKFQRIIGDNEWFMNWNPQNIPLINRKHFSIECKECCWQGYQLEYHMCWGGEPICYIQIPTGEFRLENCFAQDSIYYESPG